MMSGAGRQSKQSVEPTKDTIVMDKMESASTWQKCVLHHGLVPPLRLTELEKALGDKKAVLNPLLESPNRQVTETAKRLKEMMELMSSSKQQPADKPFEAMQKLVQSMQDSAEVLVENE